MNYFDESDKNVVLFISLFQRIANEFPLRMALERPFKCFPTSCGTNTMSLKNYELLCLESLRVPSSSYLPKFFLQLIRL